MGNGGPWWGSVEGEGRRAQGSEGPRTSPGNVRRQREVGSLMSQTPSGFTVPSDSDYTNSKIKLLRISRWWPQSIKVQALGSLSSEPCVITLVPHLRKLALRGAVTQNNAESKRTAHHISYHSTTPMV